MDDKQVCSHRKSAPLAAAGLVLLAISGCASPVGVNRMGEHAVYRSLTANALSTERPSPYSNQFLQRLALTERYDRDPKGALAELHAGLGHVDEKDRLFALAELAFAYADRSGDKPYFFAAAAYAYAFLFPEDSSAPLASHDPRTRLAMDLYNRSIAGGLAGSTPSEIDLSPRRIALPFGILDLRPEPSGFSYGGGLYQLTQFTTVADLEVRGFRNRYRTAGIGAPLAARFKAVSDKEATRRLPTNTTVPATVFLRFEHPRAAMCGSELVGTFEVYDGSQTPRISVGRHSVPLEYEPSVNLAYRLEGAPIWDFEIAGFRRGDFRIFGKQVTGDLFFLSPYREGRIPLVLVHGTASSPARWAELVNELISDPEIASRYQVWFYIYNTGNPVALSAMYLRENLAAARREVDPSGKDTALDRMVVAGHSQGGLLTKLTAVNSGDAFWKLNSDTPFEKAKISRESRDILARSLFVKPLPFVKRLIFLATPHKGSFLASNFLGRIARRLVNLPATVTKVSMELVRLNPARAAETAWRMPTAIDNMDWSQPFLRTLYSMPIADDVHTHSIIPVTGNGPLDGEDDGVVRYSSAHIEGVESELVVHSGHSAQALPQTIEEFRRILYLHAGVR